MSRALGILKYVPAVLCGLLGVGWVVSAAGGVTARFDPDLDTMLATGLSDDCFWILYRRPHAFPFWLNGYSFQKPRKLRLECSDKEDLKHRRDWFYVSVPIPGILIALSPISIGCLTRFRFPLWSYFAWTALVAAELAYYLR
jgi:hypothetical protein